MTDPLDADAGLVPSLARQIVLVDGRTFAISDEAGQMTSGTHGVVHDDLRHLSHLSVHVDDVHLEGLASDAHTPLSAVFVARMSNGADPMVRGVLTRRRWIASGLREDISILNTSPAPHMWSLRLTVGADFAHVFDVKAGLSKSQRTLRPTPDGWMIEADDLGAATQVRVSPGPDHVDPQAATMTWHLQVNGREGRVVTVTVEPVVERVHAGLAFPIGTAPADAIPMRRLEAWKATVPDVTSVDPRIARVVERALADISALRIIDAGHVDRVVVAAGAPWFMTVFGRDSLLTSWMTLPFDASLARGTLFALAELQGKANDPAAEEQPGKILHELRRRGGGGPFATRQRYYGTVDATPLFIMLAAEANRWRALSEADLHALTPALNAAIEWTLGPGDSNRDGYVDYRRSDPTGLSNQGWKDSWDGINFADGSLPVGPIALAEVQGYVYAALLGAAELAGWLPFTRSAEELRTRASALRDGFNRDFWDERGFFVVGLDGYGSRIDSLTSNPGHALWAGIADDDHANAYLDRLMEPSMWTGWGVRTLAEPMGAFDPLSYHNGSVWPHDTALCAAGAGRYGRWDVVDRIVDGAFAAADAFDGRPPELFAGLGRNEVPMPVPYPSSCSPQAWSSASTLLLMRTLIGLSPTADSKAIVVGRRDLTGIAELTMRGVQFDGDRYSIAIADGSSTVARDCVAADR